MPINWSGSLPFLSRSRFVISFWWRVASRQRTRKPSIVNLLAALWGATAALFHITCRHSRLKRIRWCFPLVSVGVLPMCIRASWFRLGSLNRSERLCTRSCFISSFFTLWCSDCLSASFVLVIRHTDRVFRFLALYPLSSGLFAIIAFFYNLFHVYSLTQSVLHTRSVCLVPFARFACHVCTPDAFDA